MWIDRRAVLGSALAISGAAAAAAPGPAAARGRPAKTAFRRIATEEAFATPEQMQAMFGAARTVWNSLDLGLWRAWSRLKPGEANRLHDLLLDLEEARIAEMDANGVDMHVLSLTSPGVQMLDPDTAVAVAASANDRLAAVIGRRPDRFCGLAAFAPQDPRRSVLEMERAITGLKLNGFILNSHTGGEYFDNRKFWPMLEAAEALGKPIYIHPRCPSDLMAEPFRDYGLAAGMAGFHMETSLHATRMILGGVFDQFPRLQVVLGHMGEGLPYWLYRINHVWESVTPKGPNRLKTAPEAVFRRNFIITTSGVNDHKVLRFVIDQLGADRVMWAIDYPYETSAPAVESMDSAPISDAEKEQLYHLNAERVFGIPAGGRERVRALSPA